MYPFNYYILNYRLLHRSIGLSGLVIACMVTLTGCGGGVGGLLGIPGTKQAKTVPATFNVSVGGAQPYPERAVLCSLRHPDAEKRRRQRKRHHLHDKP